MSRERPSAPPRVAPDAERFLKARDKLETADQRRAREDLERLKSAHGPSFFAGLFNPMGRASVRAPKFIRAGYEARVLDDLRDFFARRPRPWRTAARDSCKPTHKERLKMQRRAAHA